MYITNFSISIIRLVFHETTNEITKCRNNKHNNNNNNNDNNNNNENNKIIITKWKIEKKN